MVKRLSEILEKSPNMNGLISPTSQAAEGKDQTKYHIISTSYSPYRGHQPHLQDAKAWIWDLLRNTHALTLWQTCGTVTHLRTPFH